MSKPVIGMIIGLTVSLVGGVLLVDYLSLSGWLDRLCVMGCCLLAGQLLGGTLAGALGKPHAID